MVKHVDESELLSYLHKLIECEALELVRCPGRPDTDLYIPYMMNDAVEYYLLLTNCTVQGPYQEEFPQDTEMELFREESGRKGLLLRKPDGQRVSMWFDSCSRSLTLYQYHRIVHCWVEGQEHWRQLVYAVGTAHDKLVFLGPEYCNEGEKELIPLMSFAPFRYWSPISESLDEYYSNQPEGTDTMLQLMRQAGIGGKFYRQVEQYQKLQELAERNPLFQRRRRGKLRAQTKQLAEALLLPENRPLYRLIRQKLETASLSYECRIYSEGQMQQMEKERREAAAYMEQNGYQGMYPVFFRTENPEEIVYAMEEHPFTVDGLDYENFRFRIRFMGENGLL